MGKTYYIRKVRGGGVSSGPLKKKKTSVGLFSTFRHPLEGSNDSDLSVCTVPFQSIQQAMLRVTCLLKF